MHIRGESRERSSGPGAGRGSRSGAVRQSDCASPGTWVRNRYPVMVVQYLGRNEAVPLTRIEGFWGLVKRRFGRVYYSVSRRYLQSYFGEYAFKYNRRDRQEPKFVLLLNQFSERAKWSPIGEGDGSHPR